MTSPSACPYCFSPIEGEAIVTCPGCSTTQHADCWEAAEGCAVVGCAHAGAPGRSLADAAPMAVAPGPLGPTVTPTAVPAFEPQNPAYPMPYHAAPSPAPLQPAPTPYPTPWSPVQPSAAPAFDAVPSPVQPPRGFRRVRPPKGSSRTQPDPVMAPKPAPAPPRRSRRKVVLAVLGLALLAGTAGVNGAVKDQLLVADAEPAAAKPGQTAAAEPAPQAATAPVADLESDVQQQIDSLGEQPAESVDCFGGTAVAVDDTVDCVVETATSSVDISLIVTDTDPIAYDSAWDPADFRAPEPTRHQQRDEARVELNALRDQDVALLPLDGRWAVQLSSKAEGITDPMQVAANGTHTFHAPDILSEHEALRFDARFEGDVLLVKGTDFGEASSYNGKPFWITIVLGDFASSDEVERWCESQFQELTAAQLANSCLPRSLDAPH
jgi:hypothetical protein